MSVVEIDLVKRRHQALSNFLCARRSAALLRRLGMVYHAAACDAVAVEQFERWVSLLGVGR